MSNTYTFDLLMLFFNQSTSTTGSAAKEVLEKNNKTVNNFNTFFILSPLLMRQSCFKLIFMSIKFIIYFQKRDKKYI